MKELVAEEDICKFYELFSHSHHHIGSFGGIHFPTQAKPERKRKTPAGTKSQAHPESSRGDMGHHRNRFWLHQHTRYI